MTHFGIICPVATGHLNPMTTLGHELKQRGHRVTLFGIPDARAKTLAAGLEFCVIGEREFPAGSSAASFAELGKLSGLAALKYTITLFQQLTVTILREAPNAISAAGVELLLVDQTSFGGGTVADFLKLPFISVACALMLNRETGIPPINSNWSYNPAWWAQLRNQLGYRLLSRITKPVVNTVAQYRQEWQLPPHLEPNDTYSKLAQISQQPAEFEFPRQELPQCFHFTGPYSRPDSREPADFPFEQLTGQPLIYASMGTLQNKLIGVFENIAQACVGLDAQLVIALGGGNPASLPNLPGSPLVVGYAPQLELLQKATLTITHAGMNTALESLSNGVPMVAIPIANDQPGVAARITWTGTGEVISLPKLTSSRLQVAIEKVLTEDAYKQNATRLQAAIRRAGGVSRAADIVEQVAQTGQPVLAQT
ncbi:glycosyltransferase [Chamaesiphon sp. OTE_8_metabat_110]|uniref:glycosyltransferase n=1 Tax=Chamaesiphon sp. OTE_8_metabat_110 TaxID=2964696 RepID=UPI00286D4B36|nr:glycosyltransferase [Chamaesiphon sp. OTE_8_metabat_110]